MLDVEDTEGGEYEDDDSEDEREDENTDGNTEFDFNMYPEKFTPGIFARENASSPFMMSCGILQKMCVRIFNQTRWRPSEMAIVVFTRS